MFLKNNIFYILIFFVIMSCQPIEIIQPINIDYSKMGKIEIAAKEISIVNKYNPVFSDENIEGIISNTPLSIISQWNKQNISGFGYENKLIISILEASLLRKEIDNIDAKKYEEKIIYQYDIFFLIEYQLYDNNNFLLANTTVETSRSTTSKRYISLNQTEIIINDLLINGLKDFIKETKSLFTKYMFGYLK